MLEPTEKEASPFLNLQKLPGHNYNAGEEPVITDRKFLTTGPKEDETTANYNASGPLRFLSGGEAPEEGSPVDSTSQVPSSFFQLAGGAAAAFWKRSFFGRKVTPSQSQVDLITP